MDAGVPVGPPHRSRVVASRLAPSFAATSLAVAVYPTVIATTSNAPTRRGGLGTGMSNQRHPAPIATPRSRPSTILTIVTSLLPQALAADEPRTRTVTAQAPATKAHTASGTTRDLRSSRTPTAAPVIIATIDATRLGQRGLVPPASVESAANPVMVRVRTVVVRSGTPRLRTAAFRAPMARDMSTTTA